MTSSRRQFFHLGAGMAVASMAWPRKSLAHEFDLHSRQPHEDDGLIRLYSNENAYGPSSRVMDAIRAAALNSNRYPRLRYGDLVERIAAAHQVAPDQVLVGCGSTEILRTAACAFCGKGKRVIHAAPTFEAVQHYARAVDSESLAVPLTPAYAHDLDRMLTAATSSPGLVYICNPNNPTASLTPRKDLEAFISKLSGKTLVVIDEAYHHYAAPSGMYASLLDRPVDYENVIVTRTFSKVYGLAGLRLGYAIASPKVIERMRQFVNEDNINAIATEAAFVALDDDAGTSHFIQQNANDRQEFFNQAMARMLKPIDSHANFVMMNTFHPAQEIIQHFRMNNILIGRKFPPMYTYIRVSFGQPEEMLAFWRAWDLLPWSKNLMHH